MASGLGAEKSRRTRLGVGGMRDGQIAVGPLAPRSHAFLTPSLVPPSSLLLFLSLPLPLLLLSRPFLSCSLLSFLIQARLYVYARPSRCSSPLVSLLNARRTLYEHKRTPKDSRVTRNTGFSPFSYLTTFQDPLRVSSPLCSFYLYSHLVGSPIARSIPPTEIPRDSFGIVASPSISSYCRSLVCSALPFCKCSLGRRKTARYRIGDDEILLPATLLSTVRSIKCNPIVVCEARARCSIAALFSFDFSFRGEKESQTKEQFASVSVV